jgi:hypothetical protein
MPARIRVVKYPLVENGLESDIWSNQISMIPPLFETFKSQLSFSPLDWTLPWMYG